MARVVMPLLLPVIAARLLRLLLQLTLQLTPHNTQTGSVLVVRCHVPVVLFLLDIQRRGRETN
jgi:hypothetical protein